MSISAICGIERSPTTSVLPSFVSCSVSGWTPMTVSPTSTGESPLTSNTFTRFSLRMLTKAVFLLAVTSTSLGRLPTGTSQIRSPVWASIFVSVPTAAWVDPSLVA